MSPQPPATSSTSKGTGTTLYHNVQNYIKELEISEGQLSSVLKNVYENNQREEFMKRLDDRVKQYDLEIEKLCSKNYQDFVKTFNDLLSVREDTSVLKNQLIENNEKIQVLGKSLITKVDQLVLENRKQNNILLSIETLNRYMPVFNIYRQLKIQMEEKRNYYQALKLLEELENNYLPMVKNYRFAQSIHQSLPLFKHQIKDETISDLKDFLETLRVEAVKCGKIANQQMAHKIRIDKKYYLMESELEKSEDDSDLKKLPFDVVDFSPLYKNLHMNQVLGYKADFSDYYRNQRKKQLKLALDPNPNMEMNESKSETDLLDAYKRYLHNITGFFVIEDQILSSTEGLVDERYMDELFSKALPRLILIIRKIMEECSNAELMLKLKIIIVLFCITIEEVQFPTIQLSDLLKEIREKYYSMLLNKSSDKIQTILTEDNYTCMEIDSEEAYKLLMEFFPLDLKEPKSGNSEEFFRRLPYSGCVPKIFLEMKEFVNNCVKFSEGLNSSQTELDDMIRKPTNRLITERLSENIRQLINRVSLTQLVQIVVNTIYLEKSIELLEHHLLSVIKANSSKQSGKLQGISVFKDLRSEAETQIYELLNRKIDQLLDLESFNWNMTEAQGQASDYMKLLLNFLKSNLDSFSHLPSKLAQTACVSACRHVAQSLMSQMINSKVKSINYGAIEQLNLDLLQCETFAHSIRVDGLDNETILFCFADVRQMIDLVISKEWSIYLNDYGKPDNKYNRVQLINAQILLEKLREGASKGKGILFRLDIGAKTSDKDDLKLIESALKQIKNLISQTANF
ncbi:exocyst complex component 6B [Brachionus plicatilis]|uniref:Exocyst complex component n=1 Tax=Brachionus plicatilis TaxID=10195 RepID=A0A3M7QFG3_BRAPC|nr:exocyst complex component 6B [Brachionus plicatilis]